MERVIKADEVRAFLASLDKQLRKSGFILNTVRFKRTDDTYEPEILLNYERNASDTNESDSHKAD